MGSEFNLNNWSDETYKQIFAQEYAIGTAENACKWGSIRRSQGSYDLDECVDHLKQAMANKQQFRGHNLCWGMWNPQWLTDFKGTADELDAILKEHITHVIQQVPKLAAEGSDDPVTIIGWDVVNEAVADWPSRSLFKSNVWYDNLPDYVERAFRYAQEADPSMLAFYNDYNIVYQSKADKIVTMVKDMQNKGIKIDGIGIQAHVHVG